MKAIEKRASKIIVGKGNKSNASIKIPSLEVIQKKRCCILTFKCLKNDVCQNLKTTLH